MPDPNKIEVDGTEATTTEETTIEVGEQTVDVDVIQEKATKVFNKEQQTKAKETPTPTVDKKGEELLQRALDRIEALEKKNSMLEREGLLSKFDKKALDGLKDKGFDLDKVSNEELSKFAQFQTALGVATQTPRASHTVKPNDGLDTGEDFMELWNKSKGRK